MNSFDVDDMFLMGFGGEDNRGAPGTETFADPPVGFEDFKLLHDYLTSVSSIMPLLATDVRGGAGVYQRRKEIEVAEEN